MKLLPEKLKLLIFDIDDTVVESEKINISLIRDYFLNVHGIRLTKEDLDYIYGHSWRAIYERFTQKYNLKTSPDKVQEDIVSKKIEYLKDNPLRVATGVLEVLKLPIKKCAVTGNGKQEAFIILKSCNLDRYFDAVFSVDDYKKSKPSPEGFLMALDYFKVKPEEAIAFEDSASGLLAAKRAGITTFFIKEFANDDHSSIADFSFNNFYEVKEFLVQEGVL